MAVVVASLAHASQVSGPYTQTAQDALLDALLSSCEKPKNPPLSSFGRDLKPYFSTANDAPMTLVKQQKANIQKKAHFKISTPPVATAAAEAAASTKQDTETRKATSAKPSAGSKKAVTMKSKAVALKKEKTVAEPAKELDKLLLPLNKGEMAAILSWAGPGFYVAPSPDKLPLPTNLLLE